MNHQMEHGENHTFVESRRRDEIIRNATDGGLPATLTRFGSDGWISYRTCFLSCDAAEGNIWIVQPTQECPDEALTLRAGEQIGMSFRYRRAKCSFSSVVIGVVAVRGAAAADGYRAVIQWPENLQEMQRRVYRRVSPPAGRRIDVRYWQAERSSTALGPKDTLARPSDRSVLSGRLLDLSAGGLRVAIAAETRGELAKGSLVICEFSPQSGEPALRLETRLQHIEPAIGGRRSIGFQFVGLDTSTEGQYRLARLASIVTAFRRSSRSTSRSRLPAGAQ